MAEQEPVTELCAFSSPGAVPTKWAQARRGLRDAEVYWLSTVRPDGRPHVTTLLAVWLDGALYFCTGPGERKARNLAQNPHCILMTGRNDLAEGVAPSKVLGFGKGKKFSQTRWRFSRP
jgi:nitroimidazol reductase NimA-like FMN-containing flavoprotein (pyridoxamine 5'-phosphate oxidase superfamily)